MRRRPGLMVPLWAALLLGGCSELLHQPASEGSSTLALSYAVDPDRTAPSVVSAFARADAVFLRLTRSGDTAPVLEDVFAVAQGSTEIRLELEVELEGGVELFELFVEVRRGPDPLFRGEALLELRAGATSPANVQLEPIPAGISLPEPPQPLTFLGETTQLEGQVLFATGDLIPTLAVQWQSLDPGVAEVTPQGLVTARSEGDARMEGRFGTFSGTVLVQVRPEPTSLEVEPPTGEILVGETLQLSATVRDLGGSVLDRTVTWSSSAPSVASVDQQGLVMGQGVGTAVIRAEVGDLHAEATVSVDARLPSVETLAAQNVSASSATLRGQVNPHGISTQVWFEWGLTPELSDARTTSVTSLSGSSSLPVQRILSNLQVETVHYFRIVAENAEGRVVGATLSFITLQPLPAPTNLTAIENGDVTLHWEYNTEGFPDVIFEVERQQHQDGDWVLIDTTSDTFSTDPVENLDPNTGYSYRVRACRPTDCSPYSNTVQVRVLPGVQTLAAADVTTTSAILHGEVIPNSSSTRVWFEWGLSPNLSDAQTTIDTNVSGSSEVLVAAPISGLQPETVHYFRIVAENSAGRVQGQVMSFTTLEFLPAPTDFFAVQDGPVFVGWEYDRQAFSGITFHVERRTHPDGDWAVILTTTAFFDEDPGDGLEVGVTYSYRVRACRPTHCSEPSNIDTLTFEDHGS